MSDLQSKENDWASQESVTDAREGEENKGAEKGGTTKRQEIEGEREQTGREVGVRGGGHVLVTMYGIKAAVILLGTDAPTIELKYSQHISVMS